MGKILQVLECLNYTSKREISKFMGLDYSNKLRVNEQGWSPIPADIQLSI